MQLGSHAAKQLILYKTGCQMKAALPYQSSIFLRQPYQAATVELSNRCTSSALSTIPILRAHPNQHIHIQCHPHPRNKHSKPYQTPTKNCKQVHLPNDPASVIPMTSLHPEIYHSTNKVPPGSPSLDLQATVAARQKLESQQQENKGVQKVSLSRRISLYSLNITRHKAQVATKSFLY